MDGSPAAAYERLLELARRQREALRVGNLDACAALLAERERLCRALPPDLSGCEPGERERIGRLIAEILDLDRDSTLLLQVIREEASRDLSRLTAGGEGSAAYLRARSGAGPGEGALDRRG